MTCNTFPILVGCNDIGKRLNLGPRLAKNKPSEKKTNNKKPTKREMIKSYTTGTKRY